MRTHDGTPTEAERTDLAENDRGVDVDSDDQSESSARRFFDWMVVIAAALLIALLLRTFLFAHFRVEGNSMLDTVHPGDRVFVNKMSYRFGTPSRGDVVVLHELGGQRDLIKRIIAVGGEQVAIKNCVVLIDGKQLDEPYLSQQVRTDRSWCEFDPVTVDPGTVFVLGDNRPASQDSRAFGPVPTEGIVGRAVALFWPIADVRWL